jgi:hypothetical protein
MNERRAGTTPEIEARWTEMLRERGLVPDAAETEYVERMLREAAPTSTPGTNIFRRSYSARRTPSGRGMSYRPSVGTKASSGAT